MSAATAELESPSAPTTAANTPAAINASANTTLAPAAAAGASAEAIAPATPPVIPAIAAPDAHITAANAPSYEELAAIFRPIFDRIAEGAVERERNRTLAYEPVTWLREAGFGRVRIPKAYGGFGATIPQFFKLLTELATADSNISHLFRGHFAFLEGRLNTPDTASHARWFPQIAEGIIIGYAMAERTEHTGGSARLFKEDGQWFVDGTKYYSTGTIYADWIVASLLDGDERVSVAIPTNAPGVTREDDWDGFGQRLTGSGTTRFDRVKIDESAIIRRFGAADLAQSYQKSFLQLILLASVAGVGRAVLRDGLDFVRPRTRAFGVPGKSSPKDDPLVQRVIGKVASLSFSADTLVEGIATTLEEVYQAAQRGTATDALFNEAEIKAFKAQQIVLPQVLEAATLVFEVGGASATSETRRLDRHWRNARTAASHNPAIHREKAIGDYLLNGTLPDGAWREAFAKKKAAADAAAAEAAANGSTAPSSGSATSPSDSTASSSAATLATSDAISAEVPALPRDSDA